MKRRRNKPTPPLLRLEGLTKRYGDASALGPVSFEVSAGQLVALVGHNGSGKSTLLATVAGVLEPTEGEVEIAGVGAGEQAARAAVSYVRDNPILYDDVSLTEQLEYLSRLHGSDPEAHDSRGLLEDLGLGEQADNLPSTYSRGMRQKAALAVAMCRPFALLLIDEPFAGLDHEGREALLGLIRDVRRDHGSVVVATHDRQALDVFDRALVLDEGEVVYDGSPAGIPT
jgi:ABC-type multidrug transport system ATPase subunit